jgi:hypothetical protein
VITESFGGTVPGIAIGVSNVKRVPGEKISDEDGPEYAAFVMFFRDIESINRLRDRLDAISCFFEDHKEDE